MLDRFATGHDSGLAPVSKWDLPVLAGAGALRSCANDLINFLEAILGYRDSVLADAMAEMSSMRRPTGLPGMKIALGCGRYGKAQGIRFFGTAVAPGAFRSFLGF